MDESSKYKLGNSQIFLATITCPKDADLQYWIDVSHDVAIAAGLTPQEYNCAGYHGGAWTVSWFLAESHIAIDTYPESDLADLTLVSCKHFDPSALEKVLNNHGLVIIQKTILQKRFDHRWRAF